MWLDNLRMMKEQSGMTTKEISKSSGIPEPTLEKLFAGATKDPKLLTMQKLVHFFGHTLDDLDGDPSQAKTQRIYLTGGEEKLVSIYRELNEEGKEKLRDYADDLMLTGKYKKSCKPKLGEEREA